MIVKCIRSDEWVSIGKEYTVLGVYGRGSEIKYRLIGNDKRTPALHKSHLFALTSSSIPGDWLFLVHSGDKWELSPAEFADDKFWTAYFDGNPAAKIKFAEVVSRLESTK